MTRKLTPDQAERLNENLETLQDTIIHLESEIEHKNTQINQRERELFEQKQLIDFDRSQFEEHARTAEQVTKNLEYRIEEKAEKERKLQRELHRVEQLLSNIKIKYNIDADEIFMSVPSSPANAQANNTTVLMVEQANTTMNASIAADNNRDKNKDNINNTNNSGTYKIRMPSYKSGGDIETFINRYEQFCETQNIAEDQKAKLILSALDDITFTVIIRELNETERKEYKKVREHLLKRFDVLKEKGQRRLQLRQAKRKIGQDLQSFYTDILSLAAKAYPGPHTAEQAQIADDAIMDQLIYGCENEKMRLFLLEKNSKSSREALSLATSYQSAMRYNDTIRDLTITQTSVDAITSRNDANERNNYRHRQTYNNYGNNYNNSRYRQSNENEFNNTNRNNNMFSDRRTTQINEYQPYMINKGHGRYNSHLNRSYSVNPGQNRPQANPFYVNRDNNYHARKGRLQSRGMHRSNSYNNGWENRNNFSGFNRNMQNHVHWDNQVVGNQNIDAENFEDAIAHVQEVEIEQIQHTNEALNEQVTDTDSIKQNIASDTQNTQNEYSAQHIHTNTEEQRATKPAYYLSGKIGQGEVLMLCDTGSAVSLIDESIWDNIKDQVNKLNEVKYAVRSASRHSLEILGQTDIQFQLVTKKGIWIDFTYEFMIARGLSKPAILGMNFFHAQKALINLQNNVVYLHKRGIKTMHELVGCTSYNSTTGVFVNKTLTIAPRTILRTLCNVDENINEGQQLTFEPNRQIDVLIAASVDIVRDRQIMVEFTNASDNTMIIKEDTLVGVADKSEEHEGYIAETEEFACCAIETTDEKKEWFDKIEIGDNKTPTNEKEKLLAIILKYTKCFSTHDGDIGRTNIIQHKIEIEGEKPRRCAVRPLNPAMRDVLKRELNELLKNDLIQESRSDYASPVVMVRKKDGSIHFCIDFRQLNSATRFDSYPLPRVNEVLDTLSGSKIFSTLDLKSGYHQIEMYPPDMHKTAFITQFGLYEWKVMPMGAKTSGANFQRLMDTIMTGLSWKSVLVYLDDLVVFAKNYEEHYHRIEEVFQRLANANLKLSPKKCHFLQRKI